MHPAGQSGNGVFNIQVRIRWVHHHEHIPLLHPVPFLYVFLQQAAADRIEGHLDLLGSHNAIPLFLGHGYGIISLEEEHQPAHRYEPQKKQSNFHRFTMHIHVLTSKPV